jgi:hypothetical protein
MAMNRGLVAAFWVLAGQGCGVGQSSSSDADGVGAGSGSYVEHPIICDAPMCDADEGLYALSVTRPPVPMVRIDTDTIRADLAGRIAERSAEMVLIAHLAEGTPTGDAALDAALDAHPLSNEGRRTLAALLDREFDGWRDLARVPLVGDERANADAGAVGDQAPRFESAWQGLETSGCGEMRLEMSLGSVTVHERDDNISGDRVYCIVRATDARGDMELLRTDVSSTLHPGDSHPFGDGTFFGRGGPRDPGATLDVEYDCWEMDDASEYERFEEILDSVVKFANALGARAAIIKYELVARALILLGKLFDGDDYLFHTEEHFTRQDLWMLAAAEPQRSFTARGTHRGSAWSWTFSVLANACAVGENAAPGAYESGDGDGSGDGGGSATPAPVPCDGCWVGGTCKGGTTNDACGANGVDCTSCDGLEACRSGRCVFDSNRKIDVVAVSARVPETDRNGYEWDVFSGDELPDVALTLTVGGRSGSTNPVSSENPRWNTVVLNDVRVADLMDSVEVDLEDIDDGFDEFIDGCSGAVRQAELAAGHVTWGLRSLRGQPRLPVGSAPAAVPRKRLSGAAAGARHRARAVSAGSLGSPRRRLRSTGPEPFESFDVTESRHDAVRPRFFEFHAVGAGDVIVDQHPVEPVVVRRHILAGPDDPRGHDGARRGAGHDHRKPRDRAFGPTRPTRPPAPHPPRPVSHAPTLARPCRSWTSSGSSGTTSSASPATSRRRSRLSASRSAMRV